MFGVDLGDRRRVVTELRQQPVDAGVDLLHRHRVRRPGDVALAVPDVDALEQPDVALGVVAHVDGHPGPVGLGLGALAEQHELDVVLPGALLLLVRRQDGTHVVARAAGDRVPAAALLRRVGEGALSANLAHRVAVAALRRPLRVRLVRIAVLVQDRPAHELVDVRLHDHRRDARRDDDPRHRARLLDARDHVVADVLHVVEGVVVADVGDVGHAVTAGEDAVEAARLVQVRRVERQAARGMARHLPQEGRLLRIVRVAHAGAHPVALVQQQPDRPAADEACAARDGDRAALRYRSHLSISFASCRATIPDRDLPNRNRRCRSTDVGRTVRTLRTATALPPVGRPPAPGLLSCRP